MPSNHFRAGIFLISITMFVMALQAVAMKSVSHLMPLWQITVLRSFLVIVALGATYLLIRRRENQCQITPKLNRQSTVPWMPLLSRSLLMVSMNFLYYGSLPLLDVSTAAAAYYISPKLTFLLAMLFLKERIGIISILAIAMGFYGAIKIINPGNNIFTIIVLFPMLSALAYSTASVITRSHCQGCSPLMLSLGVHIGFFFCGSIASLITFMFPTQLASVTDFEFLVSRWVSMTPTLWLIVVVLAFFNMATHLGFAKSYQMAPATIIAPLEYTYLLFIGVLAYLIFTEVPSAATVHGMLLIAVAGILLIYKDSFRRLEV